jgi:hypothetical protein
VAAAGARVWQTPARHTPSRGWGLTTWVSRRKTRRRRTTRR